MFSNCPPYNCGNNRMGFSCVRSCHKYTLSVFQFSYGVRHCSGAKSGGKAGNSGGVAQPGAMVHIIGSYCSTHHFLEKVVLFVGYLRGAQPCNSICAVFVPDTADFLSHQGYCLVPGRFLQPAVLSYQRCFQPVISVYEGVPKTPLYTCGTKIRLYICTFDLYEFVVMYPHIKLAAYTAVSTAGTNLFRLPASYSR